MIRGCPFAIIRRGQKLNLAKLYFERHLERSNLGPSTAARDDYFNTFPFVYAVTDENKPKLFEKKKIQRNINIRLAAAFTILLSNFQTTRIMYS